MDNRDVTTEVLKYDVLFFMFIFRKFQFGTWVTFVTQVNCLKMAVSYRTVR